MTAFWQKVFGIALLSLGMSLHASDGEAQQVKLRASGSFTSGHTSSIAVETFKSEVARLSKGTIQVDLFPNNQLGGAFEQVDQIRTGQVEMAWAGPSFFDRLVPDLAATSLPFAVANDKQAFCMIDSEFGTYVNQKVAEKGILVLGWGSNGMRHITNNKRPIKTVEDLKGLKIRTPSGEAWNLLFRAVGANPTPIDIKELYQALQQGVVDGQENPYDNMWVRKFHEVQKYLSNSAHLYDWAFYLIHKPTFDRMAPEQQQAMRDAMFSSVAYQRALAERANGEARDKLIKGGMQYDALSAQELAKFRDATRSVYQTMRQRLGNKVMDLAEKAIKDCS